MSAGSIRSALLAASATALLLGACGDGGGDEFVASVPGPNAGALSAVSIVTEPSGPNCPFGGAKINGGIDVNGNGVLDPGEISSVQYVCNGVPGASAINALVRVVAEPTGVNCSAGGSAVLAGLDTNGNGMLDTGEVSSTAYVCAGRSGATSLIAVATEPAGSNCAHGGSRFTSGIDTNGNNVLDPGEVTSSTYACNPPPAGLTWIDAPASITALSNRGYFASGSARVTVTLPAAPAVGDVVSVLGTGTGGWALAQPPGHQIFVAGAPLRLTPTLSVKRWSALASSDDGATLYAAAFDDYLYVSGDGGSTWALAEPNRRDWTHLAVNPAGSFVLATAGSEFWARGGAGTWRRVFTSPSPLVGVSTDAQVEFPYIANENTAFRSNLVFVNPVATIPGISLQSIATPSSSETLFVAGVSGSSSSVYRSTNSGSSFTEQVTVPGLSPHVSVSADGTRALLVTSLASYLTRDAGATWSYVAPGGVRGALSRDGSTMAVVGAPGAAGGLTLSLDGGHSWSVLRAGPLAVDRIALSSDGNRAVLAGPSSPVLLTRLRHTTAGIGGSLEGAQFDSVELQHVGSGRWIIRASSSAPGFLVK
jgi:hypothetical protein